MQLSALLKVTEALSEWERHSRVPMEALSRLSLVFFTPTALPLSAFSGNDSPAG